MSAPFPLHRASALPSRALDVLRATSGGRPRTPVVAGLESTYLPLFDVDITETTGHQHAWRRDLEPLRGLVQQMRFPIRWQRVESEPGRYDWSGTDLALEHLRELGIAPIVDLLHHTSYPAWLSDGLRDPRFPGAFVRFTTAVAERYPWLEADTLVDEPFSTLHFAGHEALWPPYDSGVAGLVRLLRNVLPALSEAAGRWRELLPDARHVWVDTCEHRYDDEGGHCPSPRPLGFAALAELYADRYGLDVMLGETNLRELPSDRVSCLKYVMEQYELAVERGVPLRGFSWYPYLDSADWDSLLARPAGRVDPVGVLGLGPGGPVRTAFTQAWEAAAAAPPQPTSRPTASNHRWTWRSPGSCPRWRTGPGSTRLRARRRRPSRSTTRGRLL